MRGNFSKGIITTIICVLLCSSTIFYGLSSPQFSIFPRVLVTDASAQTTADSETDTGTTADSETDTGTTADSETDTGTTADSETDTGTTQTLTDLNNPPEANAAADPPQVDEGESVSLNGGGSSDPDNDILSFSWKQLESSNPVVSLNNADNPQASFTAPQVESDTNFVFGLTVTDGKGGTDSASVEVLVKNVAAMSPLEEAPLIDNGISSNTTSRGGANATNATLPTNATVQGLIGNLPPGYSTHNDNVNKYSIDVPSAPACSSSVTSGCWKTWVDNRGAKGDVLWKQYMRLDPNGNSVTMDFKVSVLDLKDPKYAGITSLDQLASFICAPVENGGYAVGYEGSGEAFRIAKKGGSCPYAGKFGSSERSIDYDYKYQVGAITVPEYKARSAFTIFNNFAYIVTYAVSPPSVFSAPLNLQHANTVLNSFQLSSSTGTGGGGPGCIPTAGGTAGCAPTANLPPRADAGPDQTVRPGVTVTLDGTGSSDPDGGIIASYSWTLESASPLIAGGNAPPITLQPNNNAPKPTFRAPMGLILYTFKLVVVDEEGVSSAPDTVVIRVDFTVPPPPNQPPIADAGPDQTAVQPGSTVTLTAVGSSDPDGNPITYSWENSLFPPGSKVNLPNDPQNPVRTFTAPQTTGVYTFELKVTDDKGASSAPDSVAITVQPTSAPANQPPIADAGPDQTAVQPGQRVTLDGSKSRDPDGTIVSYSWSLAGCPGGCANPIRVQPNSMVASPTFTAPQTTGVYTFELKVTDDKGASSAPDSVAIRVGAPTSGGGAGGGGTTSGGGGGGGTTSGGGGGGGTTSGGGGGGGTTSGSGGGE